MRDVLSPSSVVERKLSDVVPVVALVVGVPTWVAPPGAVKFVVMPVTGVKYGRLKAFRNSPRNSKFTLPRILTRFTALRSNRTSAGPFTTSVRRPQSPKLGVVSMQSGPFAGARYRPVGGPRAPYPVADVALTLNAFTVLSTMSC